MTPPKWLNKKDRPSPYKFASVELYETQLYLNLEIVGHIIWENKLNAKLGLEVGLQWDSHLIDLGY